MTSRKSKSARTKSFPEKRLSKISEEIEDVIVKIEQGKTEITTGYRIDVRSENAIGDMTQPISESQIH